MGKIKLISVAAASVFALNACDIGGGKVACSDENGIQVLRSLVGEEIEKSLKNQGLFDLANIRASIAALPMSFEEIRTSKEDPNSTKVFCQATFRITPSVETVKDAETVLKIRGNANSLEDFLDSYAFKKSKQSANGFEGTLLYNLQPSDNKKVIFAEIEANQDDVIQAPTQLLALAMSKKQAQEEEAEAQRIQQEEEQAAREAQEAEWQRQAELAAAQEKEAEARVAQAKSLAKLSDDKLNLVWNGLDKEARQEILPLQRAWLKERSNKCKAESLSEADKNEQTVRFHQCYARMTGERTQFLSN